MILLILIGVLWAGTAGAEPSDKNTVWGGLLGNGQLIELDKPCNIGDAALTNRDRLIHCHGYGWTETQMMPTACEQKMQAAMEAMEERVTKNEESEWTVIGDRTGTITWDHMQFYDDMTPKHHYTPDTRTAEERLEDEFKALKKRKVELAEQRVREAKEKIEREERKAKKLKADQLWTEAKACWRTP